MDSSLDDSTFCCFHETLICDLWQIVPGMQSLSAGFLGRLFGAAEVSLVCECGVAGRPGSELSAGLGLRLSSVLCEALISPADRRLSIRSCRL